MELFGIILSFPFLFVATVVYSYILKKAVARWSWIGPLFWWASISVLVLIVLELIGILTAGVASLQEDLRPVFYPIHVVLFFLSVPALANILRLQGRSRVLFFWPVTALSSAIFGVCVVLLQYHVSETLFGIE